MSFNFINKGFGDTDPSKNDEESDHLLRVAVNYMDQAKCRDQVDEITSDMLCTYEYRSGACFGDSGGPLIREGNSPDEDELVGLVSFGSDDGDVGVYTRISHLYDWIVANMCDMNPDSVPEGIDCGSVDTSNGGGNDIMLGNTFDDDDDDDDEYYYADNDDDDDNDNYSQFDDDDLSSRTFDDDDKYYYVDDDSEFDDDSRGTRNESNHLRHESQYAAAASSAGRVGRDGVVIASTATIATLLVSLI